MNESCPMRSSMAFGHSSMRLARLSEAVFGENHLVFGSDWPFPMEPVDLDERIRPARTADTIILARQP